MKIPTKIACGMMVFAYAFFQMLPVCIAAKDNEKIGLCLIAGIGLALGALAIIPKEK